MSDNRLDQDFRIPALLKFTAPTAVMMVFMALYQMVDGAFVAQFVGENALSALNIVYPVPSIMFAFSIMLSTGSSAIIARNMGEGNMHLARENFSFSVAVGLALGVAFALLGSLFMEPLLHLLGATPLLYPYCRGYLFVLMLASPLAVFQVLFQNYLCFFFFYVFIVVFHMGVSGAALATAIGYAIPGLFGLIYFLVNRKGTLYFVKPVFRGRVLLHSCTNGASEMVSNLALAITTFLFNTLMLRYAGESGVAAITIVLYAQFLMTSVFFGFSTGVAPVVSFQYGSANTVQLKKVFRNSLMIIGVISVAVFGLSQLCSGPVIRVFVTPDSPVYAITSHGFALFSISFLFAGINIFASALFTAFSNGVVSAILSFLRTFVFLILSLLLLPWLWELDGIWLAVPVAEILALCISLFYLVKLKKVYHY